MKEFQGEFLFYIAESKKLYFYSKYVRILYTMKHITHSHIFSQFPEIIQGASTKDFGPLSFTYSKGTNRVIIDRVNYLDALELDATH